MKIDFSSTAQFKDEVQFINEKNQVVKRYSISELEQYVLPNVPKYDGFEPMGIHSEWFGRYSDWCVSKYIDDNWLEVTQQFYTAKNPQEFKSVNREQEDI